MRAKDRQGLEATWPRGEPKDPGVWSLQWYREKGMCSQPGLPEFSQGWKPDGARRTVQGAGQRKEARWGAVRGALTSRLVPWNMWRMLKRTFCKAEGQTCWLWGTASNSNNQERWRLVPTAHVAVWSMCYPSLGICVWHNWCGKIKLSRFEWGVF